MGLKAKTKAIKKFVELEAPERGWIFPLLDRGVHSSVEILELIAKKLLKMDEIVEKMDMNSNTITQKL